MYMYYVSPMQGVQNSNADFYVLETPRGTLTFESAAYRGKYVYLKFGKRKNSVYVTEFSVFLVVSVCMCIHVHVMKALLLYEPIVYTTSQSTFGSK